MKKLLVILALCLSSLASWAQDENYDFYDNSTGQTLYYRITSFTTVEVVPPTGSSWTGYTQPTGSVTIPSTVTNGSITYSVTSIGNDAFYDCGSLTSATIPTSVTSIGNTVFFGCSGLTGVTIPNSVTSIGWQAFTNCPSLATMTVEEGNTIYDSRNNCNAIIETSTNTLIFGTKNTVIPNTVDSIGAYAFRGHTGLTNLTIPNSVTTIGSSAFFGCSGLTSVIIGNSVTSIGDGAFQDCSGLTSVTIPNSVTSIGRLAFEGCSGLTSVTIPNSVTTIGEDAFHGCSGLTSVTIGNSVTTIGESAFFGCTNVETLYYNAKNLTTIGYIEAPPSHECGFRMMPLQTLVIGDSVETLPEWVFYEQSNVETLYYNAKNLTTTSDWYNASEDYNTYGFRPLSIQTLVIGDSVATLPEGVFYGQSGLTSITIPDSVTTVGDYAFSGCTGLKMVSIGEAVTQIGKHTFEGCINVDTMYYNAINLMNTSVFQYEGSGFRPMQLDTLVIGSKVQTLPEDVFYYQHNLTSVTFPNSVKNIGDYAFSSCGSLSNVSFGDSVTTIGRCAFNACGFTSLTLPNSLTSIGNYAFWGCGNLRSVTFGNSLTSIGGQAFCNCDKLDNVTIPSSVTTIGDNAFYDGVKTVLYCGTAMGAPWGAQRVFGARQDSLYFNCDMTAVSGYVEGLTTANIPNGVTTIASNAFENCSTLTSVTIPPSLTTIEDNAFAGSTHVTTLYYNAKNLTTTADWYNASEDYNTYGFRPMPLQTLVIGDSVETLPKGVFYGQSNVETLYYNAKNLTTTSDWYNSSESYNTYGFRPMPLQTLVIGDSVKTLPQGVFYGQSGLTSVTIPNSVKTIGNMAFQNCSGLTSLTIPDSVTSIGNFAFSGCTNLSGALTIPSSVTYISAGAFHNCSSLESVAIPNSVTEIRSNAFLDCSSLTSVSIGSSVKKILENAFMGCTNVVTLYYNAKRLSSNSWTTTSVNEGFRPMSLHTLVIGDSVEALPEYVFSYQSNLSSVTIPNSVRTIGGSAFRNDDHLASVILPKGITTINSSTFYGCGSLTSIVIPSSVTSIGSLAFYGCNSLKTVYNLSDLDIVKGYTSHGEVARNALRVLSKDNGFTNHGAGSNALHKIDNGTYTVVAAEDDVVAHIPVATIPANFLYSAGGSAKAGGWRAKEVELTDDTSRFCAPVDFTADTVTYIREFADSHRSTLYLPFTAAIPRDFEVYAFSNYDNGTLYFAPNEDSIRAYTPYLVGYDLGKEVGTTQCTITAANATFPASVPGNYHPATHGDMTFQGTLVRTGDLSTSNYGYKDGFFVQSGGAAHVNPFRCYFTYSAGGAGQVPPHTLGVAFGDGLLGIDAPESPATDNGSIRYSNDVYDLMGRLVRKDAATLDGLPTGIYIWKGRKVLRLK